MGLAGLLLSSPAVADIYPIRGVWVAPNRDFPAGPNEACFTVRMSGVEAVARKFIAELLIFNENKRYEVKQKRTGSQHAGFHEASRGRLLGN